MSKNCVNRKRSYFTCQNCCLAIVLILFLFSLIIYLVTERITENTIFLKTNNISLVKTFHCHFWNRADFIQNDSRIAFFVEKDNKTATLFGGFYYRPLPKEIILKESDDFLALVGNTFYGGMNFNPKKKFRRESSFSFYRIQKEIRDGKPYVAKTEFLGSIETNLYGEWKEPYYLSLSPDGKHIVMNARGVNSRSLGEFRKKEVLLIWEIGDNLVEKDIVDRNGKKIPIIIKTEEELDEKDIKPANYALLKEKPGNLKNIIATSPNNRSIKLTWEQAHNANSYRIYQMNNNNKRWSCIATDIAPCEYTVIGLSSNTTYRFKIEPVNSKTGAVSMWDRTVQATTLP